MINYVEVTLVDLGFLCIIINTSSMGAIDEPTCASEVTYCGFLSGSLHYHSHDVGVKNTNVSFINTNNNNNIKFVDVTLVNLRFLCIIIKASSASTIDKPTCASEVTYRGLLSRSLHYHSHDVCVRNTNVSFNNNNIIIIITFVNDTLVDLRFLCIIINASSTGAIDKPTCASEVTYCGFLSGSQECPKCVWL